MWKAEATAVTNFLCVQRVVSWSLQVSCLHLNFLMALYYLREEFKCLVVWYVAVCPSISSSVELPTSTVHSRKCTPFTIPLTCRAVWSLRVFTQTGNDPCILCFMWTTPVQLQDPAQVLPPRWSVHNGLQAFSCSICCLVSTFCWGTFHTISLTWMSYLPSDSEPFIYHVLYNFIFLCTVNIC